MDIARNIRTLIEEPINNLGYLLSDVLYVKEDGNYYLRVIISKENGNIEIEDCVSVTKLVDPMLDDVDYINDSYILDVCSSGEGM